MNSLDSEPFSYRINLRLRAFAAMTVAISSNAAYAAAFGVGLVFDVVSAGRSFDARVRLAGKW